MDIDANAVAAVRRAAAARQGDVAGPGRGHRGVVDQFHAVVLGEAGTARAGDADMLGRAAHCGDAGGTDSHTHQQGTHPRLAATGAVDGDGTRTGINDTRIDQRDTECVARTVQTQPGETDIATARQQLYVIQLDAFDQCALPNRIGRAVTTECNVPAIAVDHRSAAELDRTTAGAVHVRAEHHGVGIAASAHVHASGCIEDDVPVRLQGQCRRCRTGFGDVLRHRDVAASGLIRTQRDVPLRCQPYRRDSTHCEAVGIAVVDGACGVARQRGDIVARVGQRVASRAKQLQAGGRHVGAGRLRYRAARRQGQVVGAYVDAGNAVHRVDREAVGVGIQQVAAQIVGRELGHVIAGILEREAAGAGAIEMQTVGRNVAAHGLSDSASALELEHAGTDVSAGCADLVSRRRSHVGIVVVRGREG